MPGAFDLERLVSESAFCGFLLALAHQYHFFLRPEIASLQFIQINAGCNVLAEVIFAVPIQFESSGYLLRIDQRSHQLPGQIVNLDFDSTRSEIVI